MFKKIIALAALLCALPVFANAATLNTWVKTGGGNIVVGANAPQTNVNGSVFRSFAVSTPVAVNAGAGFYIQTVTRNGVTVVPAGTTNTTYSTTMVPGDASMQSVIATFTSTPTPPPPVNPLVANAGVAQTLMAGTTSVTLTGSGSTGPITTYAWVNTSGPAGGSFSNAATANPTFGPLSVGSYQFRLTVSNGTFSSAATTRVTVTTSAANAAWIQCGACHQANGVGQNPNIYKQWSSSVHKTNLVLCFNCHVGTNTGGHPGSPATLQCTTCHGDFGIVPSDYVSSCASCHVGTTVHGAQVASNFRTSCIDCHSVGIKHVGTFVNDNNGVRAITAEFTKWSHHVTGVTLNDAHCAACHLEGKVSGNAIVVDTTVHMSDAKTHLRDTAAGTDADFAWDPAAPNHSGMDNFCMSCHDANGAVSPGSAAIQALINAAGPYNTGKTASASNPFGDTISNRYDKMLRPAVVDVSSQFDTTNNSHHGVKGPRYSGRTRDAAGPRTITSAGTFATNSSSTLWGKRSTIYDAVNAVTGLSEKVSNPAFNNLYVPLANAGGETAPRTGSATLGDDSTLHCGDCHTVGQWKPGTAVGFTPTKPEAVIAGTSPAIGAHGSNNEYMLRNSKGTDERHTQDAYLTGNAAGTVINPVTGLVIPAGTTQVLNPNAAFLVCFNCHSYGRYGSVYSATGTTGPHAGEYDAQGRCNGIGNNIPFNGYTTGKATDGTQFASRWGASARNLISSTPAFAPGFPLNFANAPGGVQAATYPGEQNADFGNIFGVQCLNCHNSGVGNGYGGIHGSKNNSPGTVNSGTPAVAAPAGGAYVNGMGNWAKVERFLPGLGNVMHVPGTLGGVAGGTTYGPITNSTFTYSFQTGGVMNDTNWEQVAWTQVANSPNGVTTAVRAGAGCYTLPINNAASVNSPTLGLEGQPVGGPGSAPVEVLDTWGGCDDHQGSPASGGTRGGGDHGFIKRINRPVTY